MDWQSFLPFICILLALAVIVWLLWSRQNLKAQIGASELQQKEAELWQKRYWETMSLLQAAQDRYHAADVQKTKLEAELQHQKSYHEERWNALLAADQKLRDGFEAMSQEAVRKSSDSFLQLASQMIKQQELRTQQDWEQRAHGLEKVVEPLQLSLREVQAKITDIEKQRVGAYQGMQEQILMLMETQKSAQREAQNLAMALRSPTTRGRWGEMQLKRVVELAGMLPYCDFEEQTQLEGDQRLRPDMIIRVPGGKSIVIDAKVPLLSYLEAMEQGDEDKKKELLKLHAVQVKKHIQQLSQKSYWEQLKGSADYVLLFLPGESFWSAALQADPSLIEFGAEQKVIVATPSILIALLRSAAFAWRQEDLAKNAEAISRLGRELYQRLADMSGHLFDTGKSLGNAVQSYNRLIGNMESRVLVTARRFQELKVDDSQKPIRELSPILEQARLLEI